MTLFAVTCAVSAPFIMRGFLEAEESMEIGTLALRLQCICMPLLPLNFMAGLTYQVVGNKALASLLSCSRQGLFYIPAVLVLPRAFDLFGVQCSQSVSDLLAFLFAVPFTVMFFKKLRILQKTRAFVRLRNFRPRKKNKWEELSRIWERFFLRKSERLRKIKTGYKKVSAGKIFTNCH